jgi:hypothetical protein
MDAEFLDVILSKYFLSEAQEEAFRENGFVILDDVRYDTFVQAFNELWIRDMPVYISADAILDALSLSVDRLIETFEEKVLIAELEDMLEAMEAGIRAPEAYGTGAEVEGTLDDAAAWVAVARSLLSGERVPPAHPVDGVVDEILGYVEGESLVRFSLFGMPQCEDFSQLRSGGTTRTLSASRGTSVR